MIRLLEEQNLNRLIDHALEARDEKRFYELLDEKMKWNGTK